MAYYNLLFVLSSLALIFVTCVLLKRTIYFFPLLLPAYSASWQTLSVLIVEHGFYITEQKIISYYTGGALRTLVCHAIFFIVYAICTWFYPNIKTRAANSQGDRPISLFILFWIVLGLSLSYLNVAVSPSPLTDFNITRFNFLESSEFPWVRYVTSERFFYAFSLIGAIYAYFDMRDRRFKVFSVFLYAVLILYFFLVGEKFTGPVLGTLVFFIYIAVNYRLHREARGLVISISILMAILVLFVLSFVYYNYIYRYQLKDVLGSPIRALLYRAFVLQGHTQWGLDALAVLGKGGSLRDWGDYGMSGMRIAMNAVAPVEVLKAFEGVSNASFSSAYPGVLFYTGGWWLVLITQTVGAIFYSMFSYCFIWSLSKRYVLCSVLSMQVLFTLSYIYNMGNMNALFSLKFIVSVLGIVFIMICRSALWKSGETTFQS